MKKYVFVFLGLFIWSFNLTAQAKLPQNCPSDFTLSSEFDGGMYYLHTKLYISKDSCYYWKNDHGKESKKYFKLSASQLDEIYSSLQKNKVNEIEADFSTGPVYDRGGTRMYFSWANGTQAFGVSDSGSSFVKDERELSWSAFRRDLENILKKKLK
jgi:hypothetical protein